MTDADAQPTAHPPRGSSRNAIWACILLIALVFAVFWPLLTYGFLGWDDPYTLVHNKYYNPPTLATLWRIWTDFTLWFYVPMEYTTWWVIAHFAYTPPTGPGQIGLTPWPFHAANIICHTASVLLLYRLLRRFNASPVASWFGAAVFAVHPLQVEAVAWLSSLYTSMSTAFALSSVLLYLRFSDRQITPLITESPEARQPPPPMRYGSAYALATLCYLLSLLTKPSLATLPLVIAAIEFGVRGRRRTWQFVALVPWLMLAVADTVITREAQHAWDVYAPFWLRPFVAADAIAFYLWKLFVPTGLEPVYFRTPAWLQLSGWVIRLTWIAPAVLVLLIVLFRRKAPALPTAFVVFLALLGPNLGLIIFAFQRYSTVADRYFYAAMTVVAWVIAASIDRFRGKLAIASASVIVLALALASSVQVRKWKDTQTLFGNPIGPDTTRLIVAP